MPSKKIQSVVFGLLVLLAVFFYLDYQSPVQTPKPIEAASNVGQTATQIPKINPSKALADNVKNIYAPVLMYHHVGPQIDPAGADLTVSSADFEEQVLYFRNKGYQTVLLAQVYDSLNSGTPLPAKPIVFTFDDGYKDVFENAAPILQKYEFSGTFAIATELLGRPDYAVWDDVIAARKVGMEIVAHTKNHLDLTSSVYSEEDLKREIFGSKQELEEKLNVPVDFFIYPYGKYNDRVLALVKEAGYKMAFTTAFGLYMGKENTLIEPRVRVHGQDGLMKLKKIFEPRSAPHSAVVQINP